jgi:hypothetical protein
MRVWVRVREAGPGRSGTKLSSPRVSSALVRASRQLLTDLTGEHE